MRPAERFRGAGIYILYYKGDFRSYAPGLRLKDFNCQYLVVEDIFIPLGESLMIAMHPAGPIGARPWIAISLKQVRESLVPCTQAA